MADIQPLVEETPLPNFAWFGKLPSAGDFVSRRMPYAMQQFWDRWCAGGMEILKERNSTSGWALWGNMPKWAFLVPAQPGVPIGQLGVLSPSCDRVGRNFPFLVATALLEDNFNAVMPRAAAIALAWCKVISDAQNSRTGVDVVDSLLAGALQAEMAKAPPEQDAEVTLPPGVSPLSMPWPDLVDSFDIRGSESYWWSVPPASSGFRARSHAGPLTATQFFGLCV